MKKITLEICCGSAADVFTAARAGAQRVELNSALLLGGLTPSLGQLRQAMPSGLPVMAMIRPRDGGFCYTDSEINTMLEDIAAFKNEGIHGLVFGVLSADGRVDADKNALLLKACGDCEKVFHRAIDVVPDWREALDTLVTLGFDRVLTSGQAVNAIEGADTIAEMIKYAAGRIEILPGGGIRPENAAALIALTGCSQIHSSCSLMREDSSCAANPRISFRGSTEEKNYSVCDEAKIRRMLSAL